MKRIWVWALLAALAACACYGFVQERLFAQLLWSSDGEVRLGAFTAAYWAAAGLILWRRPAWLIPAAACFVLAYSEWWCGRFFSPWAPPAVIYFLGSCYLLGRLVARRADPWIQLLAGLSLWIFAISLSVHFPVNTWFVYAAAFAIPYVIRSAWPPLGMPPFRGNAGMAALLYTLLLEWLLALKPEVSTDGLAMHLAIPDMVAYTGRFPFDFQQYVWSLMPMGGDNAFTAVYLLGGEAAARLLNFALLCVIAGMVYGVSLRWLTPAKAALAAALFASTPLVQLVTGSLFVENVWAALIVGACLALWSGEMAAAGILLGAAMSTKVGTTAFLVPAAIMGAMALRKTGQRVRKAVLACACLAAIAAPPFVYAWAKTGNPIFPFANAAFKSPYFDTSTSLQDVRYRPRQDWNALYNLTFKSKNYIEGQQGALGFQYFLLLPPLLLWIIFRRDSPRAPVLFAVTGAAITFSSLANLRYLYPALPLISMGIAWLIAEFPPLTIAGVALAGLNVWFAPASGWYHGDFALFNRAQFNEYMDFAGPQRRLIEVMNRKAPGEPVAFFLNDTIAGLHAMAYGDTWHTYKFWRRLVTAKDAGQIAALFRDYGIHYLITPVPPETEFLPVQHFVEEWTAPGGAAAGRFELRTILTAAVIKPRDIRPVGRGRYDDMDQRIEYSAGWLHDVQFKSASGGTITYSDRAGDALHFLFNGTAIRYVYTATFNRGIAEVVIDGKVRARLNLYAKDTQWQQEWVSAKLEAGPHTLDLRVTNKKDPQSAGYFVDLDRFDVDPELPR